MKNIFKVLTWWLSYFSEHIIRIIIIFTILAIALISFMGLHTENKVEDGILSGQEIIIFGITLNNWCICLTIVGFFVAALWAMYQYDKSISRNQQEKGAEIARLFSEDLLEKCSILGNVIMKSEFKNLINAENIADYNFINFDQTEIYDLYKRDDMFVEFKRIILSNEIQQIYLRILESRISFNSYNDLVVVDPSDPTKQLPKTYNITEAKKLFVLDNQNLPFKFTTLVSDVLNDLEYICMYISSQAAGSMFIYQSLHQVFLKTVSLLSIVISCYNKDYSDKHYTNIIYVYTEWQEIRNKCLKQEKKNKVKASRILNPKIKTV